MNNGKFGPMKADIAALLSILILVAARFWRTIFMGAPISRADMIAHWDSLFQGMKASSAVGIEEGAVLFMPPYRFLVAHLWRAGEIPLWNQYSCLGCPLIGDPQSIVFSPLLWPLIIEPSQYVYNLTLVLELVIMAAGMYLLARQLSLGITTSLFAALTICFCPYLQWYLELLGSGYCLIPFLFFAFAKLAKDLNLRSAALAGLAASLIVLSAHPETSLCAVSVACIFMFLLVWVFTQTERKKAFSKAALLLLLAGGLSVCITAPVLTQTAEFILNSDSYKYNTTNNSFIAWQAMLANLVMPANGAISPYLGSAAFLVATLGLFGKQKRLTIWIMVLFATILGMNAKIGPFQYLYQFKPFNLIVATYFTPVTILLFTLIAALGFERLTDRERNLSKLEWLSLISVAIIAIALRPVLIQSGFSFEQFNFDLAFPSPGPSRIHWNLQTIAIVITLVLIFLRTRLLFRNHSLTLPVVASLGILCQLIISYQALPVREPFDYPEVAPLKALKADGSRMVALGPHLYKPNTNLVQAIRDFRFLNAIFPKRFIQFAEKSGATITSFKVEYNLPLSPLLNIAGVKNILSLQPVYSDSSSGALPLLKSSTKTPIVFGEDSGLTLEKLESIYIPADRSVLGKVTYRFSKNSSNLSYQLVLNSSESGTALYWSDLKPVIHQKERAGELICNHFSIPIPSKLPAGTRLLCGLRIQDRNTGQYVLPSGPSPETSELIKLTEFVHVLAPQSSSSDTDSGTGYRLKEENEKGVRWYQSEEAKPDAYLVHKIIAVDSADEAVDKISSPNFNSDEFVVLENSELGVKTWLQIAQNVGSKPSLSKDTVKYIRESNCSIALSTDSEEPSVLVINETFYPGWKATIDGRSAPIIHGNHLFKAVLLEAGRHKVQISYFPDSLKIGLLLSIIGIAGAVILLIRKPATT